MPFKFSKFEHEFDNVPIAFHFRFMLTASFRKYFDT